MTAYSLNEGAASMTCHFCGMTTHHPDDVKYRFCGKCKIYHVTNFVMFTVYQHPSDFPQHFVVRPWYVGPGKVAPGTVAWKAKTLSGARAEIPKAADYCLGQNIEDDPKIVETWV